MLQCSSCGYTDDPRKFQGSEAFACPKCEMDESGLVWVCEICGRKNINREEIRHTSKLCFK